MKEDLTSEVGNATCSRVSVKFTADEREILDGLPVIFTAGSRVTAFLSLNVFSFGNPMN